MGREFSIYVICGSFKRVFNIHFISCMRALNFKSIHSLQLVILTFYNAIFWGVGTSACSLRGYGRVY